MLKEKNYLQVGKSRWKFNRLERVGKFLKTERVQNVMRYIPTITFLHTCDFA